uniref:Uncharacterized protein n=1 Tax=Lotharella globosa TaxID=91324 RepID=A0A7S3YZN9_9EUKA|mmetsp:Transcript_7870/g.15375  ORF Transcript_7870/g.15375 Transcript_7870/m.15375 type:complete len:133 (+) Transcript_7870:85-483(+)
MAKKIDVAKMLTPLDDAETGLSPFPMFGGGNMCNCNCVCPKVDGVYQCHLKKNIYEPCKDLIPYLKEHQKEFVGQEGKTVAEKIKKDIKRVHVSLLKEEEKIPGIKIVVGRRCIVRVNNDGKVVSASSMASL